LLSPTNQATQAANKNANHNVLNVLPVTTLRTIDLQGKKKSGPLFSIFWAELSDFFERNSAPEYVQSNLLQRQDGQVGPFRPYFVYFGLSWAVRRVL